jgi:hypothetical protein
MTDLQHTALMPKQPIPVSRIIVPKGTSRPVDAGNETAEVIQSD